VLRKIGVKWEVPLSLLLHRASSRYSHTRSVFYRVENTELHSWLVSPSVDATDVALPAQLPRFWHFNLWATDCKQSGAVTYMLSSILTIITQKSYDFWWMTNVMHEFSSVCLFLFTTLYMFRAQSAHHEERQIFSIQPLVTVILCWWPRCVQVPTQNNCYQRLYWNNLSLLMMSTVCSKHVESCK